jgi:ABC-2 type transport system ATP-binding protein
MTPDILELNQVLKTYGAYKAVNEVSFKVPKGSIFGLLGPNGAGKTSLIRIITTITRADSGSVVFDGEPLNSRHPELIGYMPEERGLYKKMKVTEHLLYLARLKGMGKAEALKALDNWYDKLAITDWRHKKIEELSKGMQQKIQFIATVLHQPRLLILDEPFSGLDPINTNLIKDEIEALSRQGVTILFSTHRMEQVEEICERIVLINRGNLILEGDVKTIKQQMKANLYKVDFRGELPADFQTQMAVVHQDSGSVTIQMAQGTSPNALLSYFINQGIEIQGFNEILPSLNEIFIRRVGESNQIEA